MTKLEGYWWCEGCQEACDGAVVTYEHRHDTRAGGCGSIVVWRDEAWESAKFIEIADEIRAMAAKTDVWDRLGRITGIMVKIRRLVMTGSDAISCKKQARAAIATATAYQPVTDPRESKEHNLGWR